MTYFVGIPLDTVDDEDLGKLAIYCSSTLQTLLQLVGSIANYRAMKTYHVTFVLMYIQGITLCVSVMTVYESRLGSVICITVTVLQ